MSFPLLKGLALEIDDEIAADEMDKEMLQEIVNNTKLSEGYLTLARDIEVMEAKSPEDIYKVHLIDGRGASSSLDSARQNLAATFVNAFVNAGFGQDKLMTAPSDSSSSGSSGNWLFKNKEHGKASAAASLQVCGNVAQKVKLHPAPTHSPVQVQSVAPLSHGIWVNLMRLWKWQAARLHDVPNGEMISDHKEKGERKEQRYGNPHVLLDHVLIDSRGISLVDGWLVG
ncbi:26S proteasome non-ATPase regulatory subunit 2 homolog A-like [Lolium rigidum]|uniref:26S proteasome non-ATPase regulatory subunit 2 homolog A-like n=1 Tax=Lolium rigidum TaxID=89674 RepID=UPI001F5C4C6C|nr:26S proteasome non-ATPase regulatory subunit 2 homolog A-like [Lolium rigidum]